MTNRDNIVRGAIIFLAFLFVAFPITLLYGAETSQRNATLYNLKGTVEVQVKGSDWQPATENMVLFEKDSVRTGANSTANILLDENGKTGDLKLRENSLLRFDQMQLSPENGEKHTLLDLAIGKVLVHAEKLKGNSTFEVKTPTSTTGVRGTVFEVSVEENK